MEINAERVIELVKSVRPLFMDHERASRITVKGAADFVTQVDFLVQELSLIHICTLNICATRRPDFSTTAGPSMKGIISAESSGAEETAGLP